MINFDPITHTYDSNGVVYTSVTTLLKKYGLSADYSNIPQDILNKAAARGHATHKAIEDYINLKVVDPNNVDLSNFIKYITARTITDMVAEEIIYDPFYKIAGTIDIQYTDNGEEIIADHKTTSQIHWDSVAWQLSIYNFIKCKGDIIQYYLKKLKVLHYYNGKLTVRELPPIEYDEVVKLLTANLNDLPYTYQPDLTKIMSHSESVMLRAILDDIEQCQTLLSDLQKKKEVMQKKLVQRMVDNQKHQCCIEGIELTYTDDLTRKSIDLDLVKSLCNSFNVDINTLYKTNNVKPSLKIKRRDK